jgi:hypothetical protein
MRWQCGVVVLALAGGPGAQARAVAKEYLHDLARGDGKAACRLLSKKAMKEGEYHSFAQCAREHSHIRALGHVPIVKVDVRSKTDVDVVVYKRGVPDSGGVLPLHKYATGWLIDND